MKLDPLTCDALCLWAKRIAVAVLAAAFGHQVLLSWQSYLKEQVVTVSSWVESSDEAFPEMSACAYDRKPTECHDDLADCFEQAKGSVILKAQQRVGESLETYQSNANDSQIREFYISAPFAMGGVTKCFTFRAPQGSTGGVVDFVRLLFQLNMDDFLLIVTFYDRGLYYPTSYWQHGSARLTVKKKSRINSTHSEMYIPTYGLSKKKIEKLETSNYQCLQEGARDFWDCYQDYLDGQLGCRLPWNGSKTFRNCSGPADTARFHNLSHSLFHASRPSFIRLTGCLPPCAYFSHKVEVLHEGAVKVETGRQFGEGFAVSLKGTGHEVDAEVLRYGPKDLVADIGGYLGLLLGCSALNAFDIILNFARNKMAKSK